MPHLAQRRSISLLLEHKSIKDVIPRTYNLDCLFVNPPSPDGEVYIRDIHRVGRRSREKMIWPQVEMAGLAAMIYPQKKIELIDCIAEYMGWHKFEALLEEKKPKYLVTNVTAPTITNDMKVTFLARRYGTKTIAIGSHVTPMWKETMEDYPTLDFIIRFEPEVTFKELIDNLEAGVEDFSHISGLVWRKNGMLINNPDRPNIENMDDLPMPLYHLLPMHKYKIPMIKGNYCFVTTSRGCSAGCRFCIKHVMWDFSVRSHSPERTIEEIIELKRLGVNSIHFYADLFTVKRDYVIELSKQLIERNIKIRWTCNSRVDFIDEEMLELMAKSGCWMISWGLESGSEEVLKHMKKGINEEKTRKALAASKKFGIKNWGYFIIGMPGETVDTIKQTIRFAKSLPLDIALFHIAVPYPGTPFYYDALENGWIKMTKYEDFDMDQSTVLNYPHLSNEQIQYWAKRAFREWAFRPAPALTFLKSANSLATLKDLLTIGVSHFKWVGNK
ncbi:radical SAM protein [Candidatus Chlorohelix sp.]|uniref:B12-binding domain-containing radical SAM protein n=1 Tax=Candidatus Chlorohelix sp. TaxID=3139201 RepID=UPI003029DFE6